MAARGELLGDRYRLDDRIATGGMGDVWQGTDTVLGRDVAVKTLHGDRATDPGFQTRFRHEAQAMALLHHPNIADVYDYGQSGSDAYIVMARVDGEPIDRRIAERGRLTVPETLSIVAQAGRALDAAHRAGIVHRDVKPGNLIIQPDGPVVLVDFGVARSTHSAALTGAREVVGTALYIAPEQVSKQVTGPPADIYALGAVAYHCLAGRPPFLGDNPVAVAMRHLEDDPPDLPDDVPKQVQALVATAMAKNPTDRFRSAAAMADAAETAAGSRVAAAATAVRPSPSGDETLVLSEAPPPGRRRGALLAGIAGLLVLAAVGAAVAFGNLGGLLPGDPRRGPSTAVTVSPDTNGASESPGAGPSDGPGGAGANAGGGPTPSRTTSSTLTVRPSRTTGAPAASATPSRSPTSSPRVTATTTRATTTPSAGVTTTSTLQQTAQGGATASAGATP